MVIEYIGSIIRNEVANRREQIYEKQVGPCRVALFAFVSSWRDLFIPFLRVFNQHIA